MSANQAMRERLVVAALESMRTRGVAGTTTKSVARLAGVAEGSIYNHFANRSELIVEAFSQATGDLRQHARSLSDMVGVRTVEDNIVGLMEAIVHFFREFSPMLGSILGDPKLREWLTRAELRDADGETLSPATGIKELGTYLEKEHGEGRLPSRPSWPAAAAMLIGACQQYVYLEQLTQGGIHQVMPTPERSDAEFAAEVFATLFGQ
ncbi:TetR/AcrR family transcriptional regulator [Nesterenkonia haasae]|uniref:TetR/AcrR family transcriptional regulator n=1 Tax=Nesterenkonia haasae TaxID=2587813 RepID=UPI00139173B8|nr:TetR/AcrR family transcriptional regulator [Nesterenkonia haasae]NDK31676.1 TetR/AcrR family transcriptional regulator [Nesterenkonia haasae]